MQYILECKNETDSNWTFFIYQKMPGQSSQVASLAWLVRSVPAGATTRFGWEMDYSFVWGDLPTVEPGAVFRINGSEPAFPRGENLAVFRADDNHPFLSTPTQGNPQNTMLIQVSPNVPNNTYATGIGMAGRTVWIESVIASREQFYASNPIYYIAASNGIQTGTVLPMEVDKSVAIPYNNVSTMYATLQQDGTWSISAQNI